MDPYNISVNAELANTLASRFLTIAGEEFAKHGNDPHAAVILATAIALFTRNADKAAPGTRLVAAQMLQEG